jgi:hypothetical protein
MRPRIPPALLAPFLALVSAFAGLPAEGATPPSGRVPGATVFRVLLIGNSYLNGTDNLLPGFFNRAAGCSLELRSIVPGGRTLHEHLADPAVIDAIRTGRWDAVVLQDQSLMPSLAWQEFRSAPNGATFAAVAAQRASARSGGGPGPLEGFWTGAHGLAQLVLSNSSARVLLFSAWARHSDDTSVLSRYPGGNGAERAAAMREGNDRAYAAVQAAIGPRAAVVRAGDAWAAALRADPALRLHAPDGSHGNAEGYYLAAACLFEAITGRDVRRNPYDGGLAPARAAFLRGIAAEAP